MLAEVKIAPSARLRVVPRGRPAPASREAPPAPATPARKKRKRSPARPAAVAALLLSLCALGVSALVASQIARIEGAIRAEAVERAWSALLRPGGGNAGKADALNTLWSAGQVLDGADLSCRNIGDYDAAASRCARAPRFAGLRLSYFGQARPQPDLLPSASVLDNPDIRSVDLADAVIDQARIEQMSFAGSNFDRVRITGSVLSSVRLEGSMRDMSIAGSTLGDSWLEGDMRGLEIAESDISGLTFVGHGAPAQIRLRDDWAWADMPPVTFAAGEEEGSLRPLPEDMLRSVRLCMPPLTKSGEIVALEARRYTAERNADCQVMSVIASQFLFPNAYGLSEGPASPIDRHAAVLADMLSR